MAVYTKLEKEEIDNILLNYKLGKLKRFEGISEGIENCLLYTSPSPRD